MLIYQTDDGTLHIGDGSDSEQIINAVYRARKGKQLIIRSAEFVEIDEHTGDEKRLFPVKAIRSRFGTREVRQVKRSTPTESIIGSIAHSRANR